MLLYRNAQVGQVILTLPHSLAQTNIIGGTILQLTFATWAMYTLYLLGAASVLKLPVSIQLGACIAQAMQSHVILPL